MIYGPKSKVQGIVIDNQVNILSDALTILSQSANTQQSKPWISGSYSKLFYLLLNRFIHEKDDKE